MATKAFTARLVLESDEDRAALWRTHRIFNESLRWVVRQLHRMKRGESDPRHARIFQAIRSNQHASAVLEAVTSPTWTSGKDDEWCQLARELCAEGTLLFDRKEALPGVSKEFRRKLFESAFQMISGHQELLRLWEAEHEQWLRQRAEWEHDNPEYMAVRPLLAAFEAEHGQAAKRRQRWHKWLAFLRAHPELATWRGGLPGVNPIPADGSRRIRRARRNKRNKAEAQEFFAANPELAELDKLHGYCQRQFVRPWATRRNQDGFRHRPTFTEPSAERHPFWYQFKKGATYKALDLDAGTVRLKVLSSDDAAPGSEWRTFAFRPDPRLRRIREAAEAKSVGRKKYSLIFDDPALRIERPAEIRGAKLIFRPACPEGAVYLSITCDVPDLPRRLSITQKSCDRYSPAWVYKKARQELDDQEPVTCAVDLGIRHLGAATVRRGGTIVRARILREEAEPGRGPGLRRIAGHKRQLSKGRRKRGKPVAGQASFVDLQRHVDKMGQDRFKKGARRIVDFAREHECDIIILENLAGMIPDAERDRGLNRALVNWNRGNLAKWVKQLANDAGLLVVEVPPHWTSQLCSRCGALGARFSAGSDETTGQPGAALFEPVGKLFACPDCGYVANADHNASVNLHKRFDGTLPKVDRLRKRVYRVTKPGDAPLEVALDDIEARVRARAETMCRGRPLPF